MHAWRNSHGVMHHIVIKECCYWDWYAGVNEQHSPCIELACCDNCNTGMQHMLTCNFYSTSYIIIIHWHLYETFFSVIISASSIYYGTTKTNTLIMQLHLTVLRLLYVCEYFLPVPNGHWNSYYSSSGLKFSKAVNFTCSLLTLN